MAKQVTQQPLVPQQQGPASGKTGNIDINELASILMKMGQQQGSQNNGALDKLAQVLSRRIEREEAELAFKDESAKAAQKAGAQTMALQRQREESIQSNCGHTKPLRGGTAIAGQRDHQGHYRFICQFCSKEYVDGEVPIQLRPDMSMIGGPQQ